ncbi:hypothetical protein FACS189413_18740 [Bacteroidia bacterium]|nr:hypothetical protein FACS189413_18740 [Bacteroidia bacterium]
MEMGQKIKEVLEQRGLPVPASDLPAENKKTRVFVEVEIDNDLRNKLSSQIVALLDEK